MKTKIHSTAIIDPKSEIDTNVEIGPFCIIKKGVRIKKGTRLLSHVIVDGYTEIGEQCIIYPFSSIGFPPQDLKYKGEKTKLFIGKNNIIREYVTLHRASIGGDGVTSIADNNFLMVAVHQFTRIGKLAMIGGFSGIGQDIPPYMIASGARAKLFGPNIIGLKRHGFSDAKINAIKKAYKVLIREKRTLKDALKKIEADLPVSDEIKHLIKFIEKNKRGICR
jgi:UDP-N-acetylglucosamine acyltransferase